MALLPLDDRDWERAAARLRMNPRTRYRYTGRDGALDRLSAPDISDRSYTIAAEFEAGTSVTEGVIVAWGSRFAGFVLFIKDAELCYEYVYSELLTHAIRAPFTSSAGKATIELRFHRAARTQGAPR